MSYIARVHTLVGWQPGRWQDIDLGPKTLVIGNNGTGKSRLATSLSLLISGKAPGEVFGKEDPVAAAAELALLYPAGVPEVWGEIEHGSGTNGTTSERTRIAPGAPASSHPWAHAIRAVSNALRGSPEKAAAFFAPFLIPKDADIAGRIPKEVIIAGGKAPTTPAELTRAMEDAKATINTLDAEIKRSEIVISNSPAADNHNRAQELEATVGLLERRLADYSHTVDRDTYWKNWCNQRNWFTAERGRLTEQCAQLQQMAESVEPRKHNYASVAGQADQLEQWIAQNEPPGAAQLYALVESIPDAAPGAPGHCPACRTSIDYGAWKRWVRGQRDQLAAQRTQLGQMRAWLATETAAINSFVSQLHYNGKSYEQALATYTERKAVFDQTPMPAEPQLEYKSPVPLAELQEQLRDARKLHTDAVRAIGAADAGDRERRNLLANQTTRGQWAGWLDVLEQVHGWLVQSGVERFQSRVQAHLPATDGARFRILLERSSGSPLFRFGLEEPDGTIQYLIYGAGRAIILYALAATCLDLLDENKRPRNPVLILDEERSIDPQHLVALMEALSSAPWQVVVTSTHHPERVPEGWVVRDLGRMTDDGTIPEAVLEYQRGKEKKGRGKGRGKKGAPTDTADTPLPRYVPMARPLALEDDPDAIIPPVPGDN